MTLFLMPTIDELLDGTVIKMPPTHVTFKQAQKVKEKGSEQGKLFKLAQARKCLQWPNLKALGVAGLNFGNKLRSPPTVVEVLGVKLNKYFSRFLTIAVSRYFGVIVWECEDAHFYFGYLYL